MKYLLTLIILVVVTMDGFCQNMVTKAVKSLQNGSLENAKQQIDSAGLDTSLSTEPSYYYYKGYIYKELMNKQLPENAKYYGDIAITSLLKCIDQDDPSFEKSAEKMLAFLFSRYYINCTVLLDSDMAVALQYLETYESSFSYFTDTADYKKLSGLYRLVSSKYGQMGQVATDSLQLVYFGNALFWVEKALELDKSDWKDHYNAGVICFALSGAQSTDNQHLQKAAQYLEAANQLAPSKPVLNALIEVYTVQKNETKLKGAKQQLKQY